MLSSDVGQEGRVTVNREPVEAEEPGDVVPGVTETETGNVATMEE